MLDLAIQNVIGSKLLLVGLRKKTITPFLILSTASSNLLLKLS